MQTDLHSNINNQKNSQEHSALVSLLNIPFPTVRPKDVGDNFVSVGFPTTGHAKNSSYGTRTLCTR